MSSSGCDAMMIFGLKGALHGHKILLIGFLMMMIQIVGKDLSAFTNTLLIIQPIYLIKRKN